MKSQESVLVEWAHGRLTLGEAAFALRGLRGQEADAVAAELQKMGKPQDLELAKLVSCRKYAPKYAVMDDVQALYAEERAEERRKKEREAELFRTQEAPMNFHFVFLRSGFEMHFSRAFDSERARDRAVAEFWAGTNCQTRVDIWPAKRTSPDSPTELGPRYSDAQLEELFQECQHLYGTKNQRGSR